MGLARSVIFPLNYKIMGLFWMNEFEEKTKIRFDLQRLDVGCTLGFFTMDHDLEKLALTDSEAETLRDLLNEKYPLSDESQAEN